MATLTKETEVLPNLNTRYAYVLPEKNEKRGNVFDENGRPRQEPDYKPRLNLLLRSSILWPGGKDPFTSGADGKPKERVAGKYLIRYYDGCTTLFVDDQPKDKDTIDQFVSNTRELYFLNGFLYCYGYDTMLKKYLDWASWNEASPYRVPTVDVKYKPVDIEKQSQIESDNLDKMEEALKLAKNADVKKMKMHCKFLGVMLEDYTTNIPLSDEAIRTEYRKKAKEDPYRFVSTYNDESIQVTSWIETAIETGEISTTLIPNRAVWAKKGAEICDLSGIKSKEGILNKLVEFSKTEEGADFASQLKALYN